MVPVCHRVVLSALVTLCGGCGSAATSTLPVTLRLTDNSVLSEPLAAAYARALPDLRIQVVPGAFDAIQRGEADFGFVTADKAYFAHLARATAAPRNVDIRGLAALHVTPLHFVVGPGSDIRSIADLRGRRVRVPGEPGTTPEATTFIEAVLRAFDVDPASVRLESAPAQASNWMLQDGALDAAFIFTTRYPSPTVREAMQQGVRMLPIEGPSVTRLRHEYPFVRLATVPAGTYPDQPELLRTVGLDGLLVCRADLDVSQVYGLTKHFFEAVQQLSSIALTMRSANLQNAAATPIPLHEGAALYYREQALLQ
ncbi:MAG: TAXI family TRAP transporter solute-binding subunit [Acidimicrobiia bacterium]|nr:TAXI family TRAP transporter solute-binding subunit [Acidimicrobiia bacterium]